MTEQGEQQPLIIIKKKGGHGGHHGGAWKVAYADFVTALMAFFLVMWLVSQDEIVKINVAGWFNDPMNWGKTKSGSQSILKGGPSILKKSSPSIPSRPMNEQQARDVLKRAGERIGEALAQLPEFESLKDHIEIEMTEEGLRIELIESISSQSDSAYFFGIGSPELSSMGETILSSIAGEISKLNNKVIIEGHTDSRQYVYKSKYSNWELSADRANSARKLMEMKGLNPGQIREIRGYAANRPKIADNPKDSRNRRISIVVLSDFVQSSVESMELHEVINGQVVKDSN